MTTTLEATASAALAIALKRRLADEIAAARATLADPALPREAVVHRVRRCLKRARNLWFVLEPVAGDREGRARRVRECARLLADARDADVMAAEARRLADDGRDDEAARFARVCADRAAEAHLRTPDFAAVDARLRACEADVQSLPRVFPAGRLLHEGLVVTYRRGRRIWRDLDDGAGDETLHEWRRHVARRRHLSELVPFAASSTAPSLRDDLGRLGDVLGEEHDLAVMSERVVDDAGLTAGEADRTALLARFARRRKALRKEALELGEDLYGARTRAFERELERLADL